jgi:hypothetical protein
MGNRIRAGASLAVVLLTCSALAADALESGPQPGQKLPGPFHPLNITGRAAGTKACLV